MTDKLQLKISSCYDKRAYEADHFIKLAACSENSALSLVDSYDEADIVLVTDINHRNLYADVLAKKEHVSAYKKLVCYRERDTYPEKIPGIYGNAKKDSSGARGGAYFSHQELRKIDFNCDEKYADRPYLFSYMGRSCNKLRKHILNLSSSHSAYIEDTTDTYPLYNPVKKIDKAEWKAQRDHYLSILKDSKFVLAPKGSGPATVRQYEAMACGCVPVVLSDNLKQPFCIDWDSCSICVPESEVYNIPNILHTAESRFPEMSAAARRAYENLMDPVFYWRYIEDAIIDIYKNDFEKRASIKYLRLAIIIRAVRRTVYRRKNDIKRIIANLR